MEAGSQVERKPSRRVLFPVCQAKWWTAVVLTVAALLPASSAEVLAPTTCAAFGFASYQTAFAYSAFVTYNLPSDCPPQNVR